MTSEVKIKSLTCFEWTLQGPGVVTTLASNTFTFQDQKCHLEIYLQTSNFNSSLYFVSERELQLPVYIIARVVTASDTLSVQSQSVRMKNQIIWSYAARDLRGSLLTVEVTVHDDRFTDDKCVQTPTYIDTRFSLERSSSDLEKMFNDGSDHDVEFIFGDGTIKAHKSILGCRSDVFISMLGSNMLEAKTGQINIEDMDITVFRQFLKCLYTGMLPQLTLDTAVQFYVASDKYAISTLKLQCAEFLTDNLTHDNACEILVLADRHSDPEFKKWVIKYVNKEKLPVKLEREKWADFCSQYWELAMEVYDSFCRYICPE